MKTWTNQSPCGAIELPRGTLPTSGAVMEALIRRGHCLRAQALFDAAKTSYRALSRGLERVAAGWRRFNAHRKAIADLNRLDDRLLADIGIRREQIPLVVDGLDVPGRGHQPQPDTRIEPARTGGLDCGPAVNDEDCRAAAA